MEPIKWPLEVSTAMKADITAGKVNEMIEDQETNFTNFADWLNQLEDRVTKLEKKSERKSRKA